LSLPTDCLGKKIVAVGRIIKTFGVQGGFVVRLLQKADEMTASPEWIFIELQGAPVPFRTRPDECFIKDPDHLVLAIDQLTSPSQTQPVMQALVYFPGELSDWLTADDEVEDELTGYRFTDLNSGKTGQVTGLLDIPMNPLLELISDGKELLVPYKEEFILQINDKKREILIRIPPELFDL